jgi:flagellar basal body-associated protein FliL
MSISSKAMLMLLMMPLVLIVVVIAIYGYFQYLKSKSDEATAASDMKGDEPPLPPSLKFARAAMVAICGVAVLVAIL